MPKKEAKVKKESAKKPASEPKKQTKATKGKKKVEQLNVFDEVVTKKVSTEQAKQEIAEEIVGLTENFALQDIFTSIKSLDFFKSPDDECLEKNCDNPVSSGDYCRFHYIKNWKDTKRRENILTEGKLQIFIEELVSKYTVKQIEGLLEDLTDEKSFFQVLQELNIDSSLEESFDDADADATPDDQDIAFETKVVAQPAFDE